MLGSTIIKVFCNAFENATDVISRQYFQDKKKIGKIRIKTIHCEQRYKPGHVTISCNEFSHIIQQNNFEGLHTTLTRYILQSFF